MQTDTKLNKMKETVLKYAVLTWNRLHIVQNKMSFIVISFKPMVSYKLLEINVSIYIYKILEAIIDMALMKAVNLNHLLT